MSVLWKGGGGGQREAGDYCDVRPTCGALLGRREKLLACLPLDVSLYGCPYLMPIKVKWEVDMGRRDIRKEAGAVTLAIYS